MKKNNKGFTLAELLIVVAIIAVLVAVAIPTFKTQLDNAKLAADLANVRSDYSEKLAQALTQTPPSYTVEIDESVATNNSEVTVDNGVVTVTLGSKSQTFTVGTDVTVTVKDRT